MAVVPSETDLLIAYRHYTRTVVNINLEDKGQKVIGSEEMTRDFKEAMEIIAENYAREQLIDEYEIIEYRHHLDQLPRHTCVQGRDGFMHVVIEPGKYILAVSNSGRFHDSESIELPATVRYKPKPARE